jgi:hypothetical protein
MLTRRRVLVLASAGCVMALLVGLRPISDVDLFWQLRLGQLSGAAGRLVTQDPFTYTHPGESFPPLCWLAQLVYAALFGLGQSLRALQIVDNLLFVGAFLVAGFAVRPSSVRPAAVAGALALGFLAALPHNSLRPQTFALFAFALLFALHSSRRPAWVKLVGGGLILVAWQNLHPSVVVAGIALTASLVADGLEWLRGRRPDQPRTTAALLLLVALCQFATPVGPDIVAVSSRNAWLSRHLPQPCTEWLPCWDDRVLSLALLSFWLPAAVTLLLLIRIRFRAATADLILAAAMGLLTASALRFGLFLAVALVPVWARLLEKVLPAAAPVDEKRAGILMAPALVAVVLAAALPVLGRPQLFGPGVPQAGVELLKARLPAGRLYNFQPYGGPLVWEGDGRWSVLMDGRIYVFSDAEWTEYYDAAAGRTPVDDLVSRHAPDAFVLHPFVQAGLIDRLRDHPRWREIHADDNCCVFVRN